MPQKNKEDLIDSRAQHIISSAINLFESIDNSFSPNEADALKKRFISSIKGADASRFSRMMKRIKNGTDLDDLDDNNNT